MYFEMKTKQRKKPGQILTHNVSVLRLTGQHFNRCATEAAQHSIVTEI